MENQRKNKKKLISKILILLAGALMIALLCVIIAQTIKIHNLTNKVNELSQTYQSEATEEKA